ncbi:MAG: ChbG/HpnK family deacetylase [Actinobacteria bacterium]|nr:ChbG/HpnK family deacetylase [Actinomycetota bacterium]
MSTISVLCSAFPRVESHKSICRETRVTATMCARRYWVRTGRCSSISYRLVERELPTPRGFVISPTATSSTRRSRACRPKPRPSRDELPASLSTCPMRTRALAQHSSVTQSCNLRSATKKLRLHPDSSPMSTPSTIVLHQDDIGMCHGANVAFAELSATGTITSGSVMVPCPWFSEAAEMARNNTSLDLGVHLRPAALSTTRATCGEMSPRLGEMPTLVRPPRRCAPKSSEPWQAGLMSRISMPTWAPHLHPSSVANISVSPTNMRFRRS